MEESEEGSWRDFESDPACFNELLSALGVTGLVVDDLYSLDKETIAAHQPLHALIFLFKWVGGADAKSKIGGSFDDAFSGFFMNQLVNNACATIAVLNGLFNIPKANLGPELTQLLEFTAPLDPETRGHACTSSDFIRTAHNSLSPPSAVSLAGLGLPRSAEDAYHFVVYLPRDGKVYELDGLKPAPVNHGQYEESGEGWSKKVREVIEGRIASYPAGSLHFNLLAVHEDTLPSLRTRFQEAEKVGSMEGDLLSAQIDMEEQKRASWAFENAVRRHNHVGLIHGLLLALARSGGMDKAVNDGKAKMKERISQAEKLKESGASSDD